jgi:hypothetical protein
MYALSVPSKFHRKVDREQDGLLGPVETIGRESVRIRRMPWLLVRRPQTVLLNSTYYDHSGNRIKKVNYDTNDGTPESEVYIYDISGRKTESILRQSSRTRRKIYNYDDLKNTVEILEQVVSPRQTINRKYVSISDDDGNEIESNYSDDSGISIKAFYRYAYDDKGRVNLIETLNESRLPYHEILLEYDAEGRLNAQSFCGGNGVYEKGLFNYNAQERTEERLIYRADGKASRTVYRYDSRDNLVETTHYNPTCLVGQTSHVFQYDEFGNWVEKVTRSLNPETKKPISSWVERQRINYWT